MTDAATKARYVGMVSEFRAFYDRNGYLPYQAALRLIEIAEKLLE